MASKNGTDRRDEDGKLVIYLEYGYILSISFYRGLSRLQVLTVPEPQYAISHQSGMLPQDVRVLRGPYFLLRPVQLPSRRLPEDSTQEQIPSTNLRGHRRGARS